MTPFRQVAIIGTGLIGGSVGLALRKKNIVRVGFDRPAVLRKAKKAGAIDRSAKNLGEAVANSGLVILAMPVRGILESIPTIARLAPPLTLITDVGSTKAEICGLAKKLRLNNFIGGHPLAGKEKSGIEIADGHLFAGKSWFLCPSGNSTAPGRMKSFVRLLGARPVVVEPERHDRMLAATSHLPQLVSTLLAATVAELLGEEAKRLRPFAGPGLRDTTRLARSSFSVWGDVFSSNQTEVGRALEMFARKTAEHSGNFPNLDGIQRQFEIANRISREMD